jgi:hypothetical protein
MRLRTAVVMLMLATPVVTGSVADAGPEAERLPTGHRIVRAWPPPAPGLVPVAAVRLDRDRDGDADIAVLYRGGDGGAVAWVPVRGSAVGDVERVVALGFAPSAAAAVADVDADGREDLVVAQAAAAALHVLAVAADGRLDAGQPFPLPGLAARLALADRPRDGMPDLTVEPTAGTEAPGRWVAAGSPSGLAAALAAKAWRWEESAAAAPPGRHGAGELLVTHLDADAHPDLLLALDGGGVGLAKLAIDAVIEVNSTSEAVDFVGAQQVGDLPGPDGLVTLREAILAANNTAGADVVAFNIPAAGNDCHDGACWFTPSDVEAGPLPAITESLTLDGYTQTTNRGDTNPNGPELVLDGLDQTGGSGLDFQSAAASALIDFVIVNFDDFGVHAFDADGLAIRGCYVGTTVAGDGAVPNGTGIQLIGGTSGATIGGTGNHGVSPVVPDRNLVSGNLGAGIDLTGAGTTGNFVLGNRVGTVRDGSAALANETGIRLDPGADDNDVGGSAAGAANLISGNSFAGVVVSGVASAAVIGNTIGAALGGMAALPNGRGISIQDGATGAIVVGPVANPNLVSGNAFAGIDISGTGTTATLLNNWIGLDATGGAALPNATGVHVVSDSSSIVIGGTATGAGNVIAGNTTHGLHLEGTGTAGVYGNRLGTNAAGTASVPNGFTNVRIEGASNFIGSALAGARNLFAGTLPGGGAIEVSGGGAAGNRICNNWFGLDASGTGVVGPPFVAIRVTQGATGTEIGGTSSACANYFAAAALGIGISDAGTTGTLVRGNVFGRSPSTTGAAFANQIAIRVSNGATSSTIGGSGGAANEIVGSLADAIEVWGATTTGNRISRNSIHDSGGLGIDLSPDGVTPNDAGDGDVGPNQLQNFPVLATAVNACGAGTTAISGSVDTPGPDSGLVELFQSATADPTGFGEATTYLASVIPAFNGSFATAVPAQPVGSVITSTFTDANGNTSELSAAIAVVATPLAPSNLGASLAAGPGANLSWVDNASDETQFRIERRAAGGSFAFLANAPANAVGFTDPGPLTAGVTYYYRVRAENGACASDWTNVASVLVPGASTPFCRTRITSGSSAQNPHVAAAGPGVFGVAWREVVDDAATLRYARLDATGATVAGPVTLRASSEQMVGQVLSSSGGSRWGMAWYERLGDRWGVFFATFDLAGNLLTGPLPISDPAARPVVNMMLRPGLAWDGQGWGVVWPDLRTGAQDVRYVHVSAAGTSKETADVVVSDGGVDAWGPRVAWNGAHHAIVWGDARTATNQLYLRRVARDGTPAAASVAVTTTAQIGLGTAFADLAWDGAGELGLAWIDLRDGGGLSAVFFRRLSTAGVPLSAETRLADPNTLGIIETQLALRRTANRWVVAAEDFRDTDPGPVEIRLSFADPATGSKLGPDVLASTPADPWFSDHPSLAWDGTTLLVGWHDAGAAPETMDVQVQAMDESGDPGVNPRRMVTGGHGPGGRAAPAAIEALGNGAAVAWLDERDGTGGSDVYFRLLDGTGTPTTAEVRAPDAASALAFAAVATAWSGEVLALAWRDGATGLPTIAFFDGAGTKLRPDVQAPLPAAGTRIDLHWTGEHFVVAWEKSGAPNGQELFTAAYLPDGTLVGGPSQVTVAAGRSQTPVLSGGGASLVVVWRDTRDGNGEIYAATLDRFGARIGAETNLTSDPSEQSQPSLAWSGSQFGLAWSDARTGTNEVRFRRLAADATPVGGEVQLSNGSSGRPVLASDGSGWGVVWYGSGAGGVLFGRVDAAGAEIGSERLALHQGAGFVIGSSGFVAWDGARYVLAIPDPVYLSGEISVKSSACVLDATPPTCPTGLGATVSGRDVTLTWTPGSDGDFALERQTIERDGARIAAPLPATVSYQDRQLEMGTYTYRVGSLNQGYLDAGSCATVQATVISLIFADGFESGDTSAWSAPFP